MQHVVVVGAGIIGLLTALELRRRGHSVEVRSMGIAEGATYAAAGMLAPAAEMAFGQDDLWPLMREAGLAHRELSTYLAARTALPIGYRDESTLVVAREHSDLLALEDLASIQRAHGATVTELLPAEARLAEPALARAVAGAVLIRQDWQVDPRLLCRAILDVLETEDDCGPAVRIRLGDVRSIEGINADRIILAAGLGVDRIEGPHRDLDLALRPVRGDILRLRAPASLLIPGDENLLTRTVRALVHGRPVYVVPRDDRGLVVGATTREDDLVGTSVGGVLNLLQDSAEIIPALRETELVEVTTRDRPATPDDLPLLGPVPHDGRVILATGFHRHGILLSAWAAARAADLVDGGEDPALPESVRPDRFTRKDTT